MTKEINELSKVVKTDLILEKGKERFFVKIIQDYTYKYEEISIENIKGKLDKNSEEYKIIHNYIKNN